eukprot:489682_1
MGAFFTDGNDDRKNDGVSADDDLVQCKCEWEWPFDQENGQNCKKCLILETNVKLCNQEILKKQSSIAAYYIIIKVNTSIGSLKLHECNKYCTIKSLKETVKNWQGCCIEGIRLFSHKNYLEDDKTLADYNISKGSTIYFQPRKRGGGLGTGHYNCEDKCLEFVNNDRSSEIKISSFHVSCKSDMIKRQNMVGIVLYEYDQKTEWTLNGVRCKSGYIVLKSTKNIQHIQSNKGIVHGKCYKSVFGEEAASTIVGGGFAFQNGRWKFIHIHLILAQIIMMREKKCICWKNNVFWQLLIIGRKEYKIRIAKI